MIVSSRRLWAAQIDSWPNSVWVFPWTMLEWAEKASNRDEKLKRYMAIALTTQHEQVMFYITDPKGGHIGARYGLDPGDYTSGFSTKKAKLVNGSLVDTKEYSI